MVYRRGIWYGDNGPHRRASGLLGNRRKVGQLGGKLSGRQQLAGLSRQAHAVGTPTLRAIRRRGTSPFVLRSAIAPRSLYSLGFAAPRAALRAAA